MLIEQFINQKIEQLLVYVQAVIDNNLHYTELDSFLLDTMEEWGSLKVTDDVPGNSKERVFWHLVHELCLHGSNNLKQDLFFLTEITTCVDFLQGHGSYPIDCIGWRPLA